MTGSSCCVDIGNSSRDYDRILRGREESPHQVRWQNVDILLERARIRLAGFFRQPAPQRFDRPHIADAGLFLDDGMDVGDDRKRVGRVERCARREFDQHVDRIGAGELCIDPAAGRHGLLLVGHLIGQPVTRIEIGIDQSQSAHESIARGCRPSDCDHPVGDQCPDAVCRRLIIDLRSEGRPSRNSRPGRHE